MKLVLMMVNDYYRFCIITITDDDHVFVCNDRDVIENKYSCDYDDLVDCNCRLW